MQYHITFKYNFAGVGMEMKVLAENPSTAMKIITRLVKKTSGLTLTDDDIESFGEVSTWMPSFDDIINSK